MKFFLKLLIFIFAAAVIIFGFFYFSKNLYAPTSERGLKPEVCFNSNCFSVELATTDAQREQGLMNRTNLDKNKGMLFIFDTDGDYPFWMKNTLIPLDMIWMDKDGRVVFIAENVQPCKVVSCLVVDPKVNAKYVLELNAGVSKQINLKAGDKAVLKY